jgi:hypothetical protein
VRGEYRRFGDAEAHIASPRVALVYENAAADLTNIVVGIQRLPRLDDGLPGAWAGQTALYHDELVAGGAYMLGDSTLLGIAGRARRTGEQTAYGADTWFRIDKRYTTVLATASSIERTAAFMGFYTLCCGIHTRTRAGFTLRTDPTSNEAAGTVAWMQVTGKRRLDLQLEGFAGTHGPGGRLLAGASW